MNATLTYQQQQVANWKGEIRKEYTETAQFSDEELLAMLRQADRENNPNVIEAEGENTEELVEREANAVYELEELRDGWLLDFVEKGGFEYLMTILKTFVTKYKDAPKSETLSVSAEVQVLRLTTYLIKVILVSCFCAQTQDSNLAGNI